MVLKLQCKIPVCEPKLGGDEIENIVACVETNWISSKGKFVESFEKQFSNYCDARFGIATSSGTTALHLALVALGISEGDEVIIPDFTMIACANAVKYTGAKPVLVDSENKTWNMNVEMVEEKITPKTKAIMPVHIYGHSVDMDVILELADKHDLYVVEDCAEAHGALYKHKPVGSLGDCGCFSFYANKIITTGEGGMIVTNDSLLTKRLRLLRDQAYEKDRRFLHRHIGYNYRMTNLQAAIGVAQMKHIDEFVEIRRRNAKTYNLLLADVEGLTLPPETEWAKNVYWMYTVLIEKSFGLSRDQLMIYLAKDGIETRPTFYPIHLQPIYRKYFEGEKYAVAEQLASKGINLPSGNTLQPIQVQYIVDKIKSAQEHSFR